MSAVDWQRLEGSAEQTAQCALLDELVDQTSRLADEQRTANLIAFLAYTANLDADEALTQLGKRRVEWLEDRVVEQLGAPS